MVIFLQSRSCFRYVPKNETEGKILGWYVDPVGGGFGPPQEPFEKQLYLLVQENRRIPCRLQVSGARGWHVRGLADLLAGLGGGVREFNACK